MRKSMLHLTVFLVLFVSLIAACNKGKEQGSTETTASLSGSILLSTDLTTITTLQQATITSTVTDTNGNPVPDGTLVTFTLGEVAMGTLSNNGIATTNNGAAVVTFTPAVGKSGIVQIGATSLGMSKFISLTVTSNSVTPTITAHPPANIVSTATPTVITVMGSSSITAVVTDATGTAVLDGTQVNFSLSDSSYGSLSNTTSSTSGGTGTATITFTASNKPGIVTVTIIAGTITKTMTVTISPVQTGSIQFVSAVPQVIGIKGAGQSETSTVSFMVKDINGNPVSDGATVTFKMQGPGGGEYIGSTPGSISAAGSTVGGAATVILNTGSVAGPVAIIASTMISGGSTIISTSTGQISIGGGVPSATHFNLATSQHNLQGFVVSGETTIISAYLADRFGNYNVLKGTSVSFYTEAGAIDRQGSTDSTGLATVIFRTQVPNPSAVAATPAETNAIATLNGNYGLAIPASNHPRNGWVTLLATVQGEESFLDENANGLFDNSYSITPCPAGYTCECTSSPPIKATDAVRTCVGNRSEAFIDIGEPFIDVNDDGCRNDGNIKYCNGGVPVANTDPFELFIDANNNSGYDFPNGIWDGPNCTATGCLTSKMIWQATTLAFTGNATYCKFSVTADSSVAYTGTSPMISFMVGDFNTNALIPGTTINVTTTGGGILSGMVNYTVPDGIPSGPTEVFFKLAAPLCGTLDTPPCIVVQNSVKVTVTSSGIAVCAPQTITGTFHL